MIPNENEELVQVKKSLVVHHPHPQGSISQHPPHWESQALCSASNESVAQRIVEKHYAGTTQQLK